MINKITTLGTYGGGLGDMLQYTTLPELFYRHGSKCYLSKNSYYRNSGIKDLLLMNPYLYGESDFVPNGGSVIYNGWDYELNNIIKLQEKNHGFEVFNELPIIYYKPKFIIEYIDKNIIDFGCNSANGLYDYDKMGNFLENLDNKQSYVLIDNIKNNGIIKTIKPKDIFDFCDILYSCNSLTTVFSGASSLASAISRMKSSFEIVVYLWDSLESVEDEPQFRYPGQTFKHFKI